VGAPYCKYCDWMKPAWDQLALGLQHDRSVVVAHMNGTLDRDFASSLGVRTFPTVLAFPKTGGAPFVYGSQVSVPSNSLPRVRETSRAGSTLDEAHCGGLVYHGPSHRALFSST
jgi:thiol-disulfide isomerase/thioredoxin